MKSQFLQQLLEIGFYDRRESIGANQNSDNLGLVKAVLVAGLYVICDAACLVADLPHLA